MQDNILSHKFEAKEELPAELARAVNSTWTPLKRLLEEHDDLVLVYENGVLKMNFSDMEGSPFYMDFLSGVFIQRLKTFGKRQPLAKALSVQNLHGRIYDLTAGQGQDMLSLAHLGYKVNAFEKNPIIYLLLLDALLRAKLSDNLIRVSTNNICLSFKDSLDVLEGITDSDVIYLDPMFPEKKKSALPKKDMVFFQRLAKSYDVSENTELLQRSLNSSSKRVVVKRPAKGDFLLKKPSYQIKSKMVRYDIYIK